MGSTKIVALLAVGLVLLASGGWLWYDIEECRGTQEVRVSAVESTPAYDIDPTPYGELSDRQRTIFDRGLSAPNGWTTADRDVEFPEYVDHEGQTYGVATIHPDDCGRPVGEVLAWAAVAGGVLALASGGWIHRRAAKLE